jgi:hypothetical protein
MEEKRGERGEGGEMCMYEKKARWKRERERRRGGKR